ncbi:MAG: amidase family protein, partial [Gallionella sp.]
MKLELDIDSLRRDYLSGTLQPMEVMRHLHSLISSDTHHAWLHVLSLDSLQEYVEALAGKDPALLPLYGIPFAIKDNIDLAGAPTTAACPAFSHTPSQHASVVQRLIAAGAIPLGKTNLDQFATGLNGTRTPHGACRNAYDSDYVSGGSSSGSAV